jgi:glutamine synthetase
MNAKAVLKYASDQGAKFVSVRFTDFPGAWQHFTFPIGELSDESFETGFGFDGSSIRGWAAIHESDMLLLPDPTRFWMEPFLLIASCRSSTGSGHGWKLKSKCDAPKR